MIEETQNKIDKPSVVFDNGNNQSETSRVSRGRVIKKDPAYHYVELKKNDSDEIQRFADMGYEPARGDESYEGSAFDDVLNTGKKPGKGDLKIRGNRLLARIKKSDYDKRNIKKLTARHNPAKKAGDRDAREMVASNAGAIVKSISTNE